MIYLRESYDFADAKVMSSLCERYDMIARLTLNVTKSLIAWQSQS